MNRFVGLVLALVCTFLYITAASAYDVVDVKDASSVKGVVKFSGTAPQDTVVSVSRDEETCGKTLQGEKFLITDSRVKNTVVWIENVKRGKSLPKTLVEITIRKCKVEPLVAVGFVGGEYDFKNDDPLLHTIQLKLGLQYQKKLSARPLTDGTTILNIALPNKGAEVKKPIKDSHKHSKETGFITVKSNSHDWMRGYVFVFDQPYAVVTDDNGEFELSGLPAGEYVIKAWHEGLGLVETTIKTTSGQTKTVEIDFSEKGKITENKASQDVKNGSSKIEFKETSHNFGSIEQGKVLSHRFEFVNSGSGKLIIKDVIPS
ncbi:MAG: carboxypeptidase regulatory-like domain-containing protein [Nitrospirae bacterium]|nr:carboxypeptidase regulatory-like domain-containing protein [Nitrospirota bacterium]